MICPEEEWHAHLAEGPRLMSRIDGVPNDAVAIGMAVNAKIISEGDKPMLVFTPA
jgi:uncharacterized OB-fold protein